jgi:fucose permease
MGYGIGSFIVPLYAYPFLAERTLVEINETSDTSLNNGSTTVTWISMPHSSFHGNFSKGHFRIMNSENESILNKQSSKFVITGESKIEYAYGIAAASLFLCSVSFLVYQILEVQYVKREQRPKATFKLSYNQTSVRSNKFIKNTKEMTFLQMINPATCADGRLWYGLKIFTFIFIFMGNLGGCERMIGSFIRSFAIDQLEFSSVDASLLNTSFWISFSVGRLLFAIAAKWISVRVLIIVETLGVAISGALLNIFAVDNSTALWVLMQPVGFLGAPLWPTGVAFTDYHVQLTGVGMTVQILGASVGGIIHLRLIGYLYETFGPRTFLYQLVGSGCVGLMIAIVLDVIGAKHGNRFGVEKDDTNRQKEESDTFM